MPIATPAAPPAPPNATPPAATPPTVAEAAPPEGKEGEKEKAPERTELDAAHDAASRARRGARRRREQQAKLDRVAHQAALSQAENTRLKGQLTELDQLRKFQADFKKDPYAAMKAAGISDKDITQRVVQEGSPEAAIAELRAELKAEIAKREQIEANHAAEKAEQVERQAERDFIGALRKNAERFPNLAKQPDDVILDLATSTLARLSKRKHPETGRPASEGIGWSQLCTYLENRYAKNASEPPDTDPKAPSPAAPVPPKPAGKKPSTLTNAMGTSKASVQPDFNKLDDQAQKRAMAEAMRAAGLAK